MTAAALFRTPGVLLVVVVAGCAGPAKREASALLEAVDRYRHASSVSNAAPIAALAAVSCTDPQVCEAKSACVAAIDPTARALSLKDEVGRRLADIEAARLAPDSPEAQDLAAKLDLATHLLRDGHAKMDDCDKKLTDLQVKYGL
jgi:hypothetical protein